MMKLWMQTPYSQLTLTPTSRRHQGHHSVQLISEAPPSAPVNRMGTLVLAARHTEAMQFHAKLADYRSKSSTPVASDHHNKSL